MTHSALDGSWPGYSIHQLYAEAGGTGQNGVDVRTVLKICIDQGTPLVSGGRDSLIKSYVFVDRSPEAFQAQVEAALAAGHPVLVASLLPIPFGWNTGTTLSQSYHEYLGVGIQTDASGKKWVLILNSWGDGWPGDAPAGTPPGVGRISFDALTQQGLQNGYTYAVIPTMTTVTPPPPPPPPPPPALAATVGGRAVAGVTNGVWPKVGDKLPFGQDVTLTVTDLRYDGTPNPPPPPPPGGLKLAVYTRRYSSGLVGIWCWVQEAGAQELSLAQLPFTHEDPQAVDPQAAGYVAATITGSLGGVALPAHATSVSGVPAIWQVLAPAPPAALSLTATDSSTPPRTGSYQGSA